MAILSRAESAYPCLISSDLTTAYHHVHALFYLDELVRFTLTEWYQVNFMNAPRKREKTKIKIESNGHSQAIFLKLIEKYTVIL